MTSRSSAPSFVRRKSSAHPFATHASKLVVLTLSVLTISYVVFGLAAMSLVLSPAQNTSKDMINQTMRSLRSTHVTIPKIVNGMETEPLQELQKRFPVHVSDDEDCVEHIIHPGIFFSGIDRIKALLPEKAETMETMRVPKFWNPPGFGDRGLRWFLGKGGSQFMTSDEARLIGSKDPKTGRETIFISVASYRDSECTPTIDSIYARARYPDRIRVAVVDQIDEKVDTPCARPTTSCALDPGQTLCRYAHLIDVYQVPAFLMTGPVLARHLAHRMYRGEYFSLQVDAHVRFVQDWDEDIVLQWKSTNNEMAVLSTYLTGIDGSIDEATHESLRKERNILCNLQYDGSGVQRRLTLKQPTKQHDPSVHGTPLLQPFWSAGFSFSRGHFIVQVPYDQYLPMLFQGEEASIVIRGFTYGYDFYAPERSVAFHIYAVKANSGRKSRHKFWENELMFKGALEKSVARLNAITGMLGGYGKKHSTASDRVTVEKETYGLGRVRSKEKYFKTFGIQPGSQSVERHLCSFVQKEMHERFTLFLRENGIGIDYNKISIEFHDQPKHDSGIAMG
jgi:hypothetical protein